MFSVRGGGDMSASPRRQSPKPHNSQWSEFGYPHNLIAVEVPIEVAGVQKRCDAIVYNQQMQPLMLIEFKAPSVHITQEVFDQAAIYNTLHVPCVLCMNAAS